MVAIRVESPPQPPQEPTAGGNVFKGAARKAAFQKEQVTYNEAEKRWRDVTEERINKFLEAATLLLAQAPNAKRSDVFGALQRAALFLGEPDVGWDRPAIRLILMASDGEDNVGHHFDGLTESTRLMLINGSGTVGSLKSLKPIRLESLKTAIRLIDEGAKS